MGGWAWLCFFVNYWPLQLPAANYPVTYLHTVQKHHCTSNKNARNQILFVGKKISTVCVVCLSGRTFWLWIEKSKKLLQIRFCEQVYTTSLRLCMVLKWWAVSRVFEVNEESVVQIDWVWSDFCLLRKVFEVEISPWKSVKSKHFQPKRRLFKKKFA